MKHVICGGDKGYLIPKKELDQKLKERFESLQGKIIKDINGLSTNAVDIHFYNTCPFEKKEDGVFLGVELTGDQVYENPIPKFHRLMVDKNIFKQLFSIKGNIRNIDIICIIDGNKIMHINGVDFEIMVGNENLYYLIEVGELGRWDCERYGDFEEIK